MAFSPHSGDRLVCHSLREDDGAPRDGRPALNGRDAINNTRQPQRRSPGDPMGARQRLTQEY
jgi:hypothetical protein